jgi:uncharacterized protein (DUF433 family)
VRKVLWIVGLENRPMDRIEVGEHIVADPNICHGSLTFRGTRLFVSDVLEMVADGRDWDAIISECHGSIAREAIAEAIRLAGKVLSAQPPETLAA